MKAGDEAHGPFSPKMKRKTIILSKGNQRQRFFTSVNQRPNQDQLYTKKGFLFLKQTTKSVY